MAGLDAAVGEHAVDAEVAGVVGHVITPLWLKCASTLEKFSRAMVISLMHISRKALKVRDKCPACRLPSRSRPPPRNCRAP